MNLVLVPQLLRVMDKMEKRSDFSGNLRNWNRLYGYSLKLSAELLGKELAIADNSPIKTLTTLEVTIVTQKAAVGLLFLLFIGILSPNGILFAKEKPESIGMLNGVVKDAARLKDKVVYVDFWASWCGPCRKSFPWLKEVSARYEEKGLKVITINLDRDRAAAKKFLEELKIPFEVVYDSTGALAEKFGVEALPSSYLFGRDGKLRSEHRGFIPANASKMDELINKLLMEGSKK